MIPGLAPTRTYFLDGALLLEVLAGTPAALAGLHPGDKIVAVDGQFIHSSNDLTDRLDRLPSQTMIHLEVVRGQGVDSQRLTMELRTSSRPEAAPKQAGRSMASAYGQPDPSTAVAAKPSHGGSRIVSALYPHP